MSELPGLFFQLLLISTISFGAGALPLIEHLAVVQLAVMSANDFGVGFALGFASPGPALISSFIGYRTAALVGVLVATLGIFTLPWVYAVTASRYFSSFFKNRSVLGFSAGARSAALGLFAVIIFKITGELPLNLGYVLITGLAAYWTLKGEPIVYAIIFGGIAGYFI